MTDQWVPGPAPAPPQWVNPLPPSNDWSDVSGCAPGGPSIVDGIIITGVPATISSLYWQVALDDGSTPPNFQINQLDGQGNFVATAVEISPSSISFIEPVMLSRDPVEPMEAVTLEYLEAHGAGLEEAPIDNTTYGRDNATWVRLPQSYLPEAPNTSQRYGRFNSVWQLDAIQTDAPSDGGTYNRSNGAWTAAVTGGPYVPISGATMTGPLIMQGSNMIALNAPLSAGQSAILGQKAGINRWQMMLGDYTTEGLNNVGSNFTLNAYSTTGATLGTWLTIARADGSTTFNGSGVTLAGGLAVNGLLVLPSINNFSIYGGAAGQVISTNGSGILSWVAQGGYTLPPASTTVLGGVKVDGTTVTAAGDGTITAHGIAEAPTDGQLYSRQSSAWTPTIVPLGDNRIINGDMRIDQRNNGAAGTATDVYTVDRWFYGTNVAGNILNWGRSYNGASSTAQFVAVGFPYDFGFQVFQARTLTAADYFTFYQPIEADMVGDFAWGTANARPVTLSFWVLSNQTGAFSGSIRNYAGTRSYPFTFNIPGPGATRIVVNIPGDTTGTWVMSGPGGGLHVIFDLGSGANFRGAAGVWTTGNLVGVTGAVSLVATIGAIFSISGVKLEIGSVATPFNRQSMAKSLADCQRYYQTTTCAARFSSSTAGQLVCNTVNWPTMRAAPTTAVVSGGASNFLSAVTLGAYDGNSGVFQITSSGAGDCYSVNNRYSLTAEL